MIAELSVATVMVVLTVAIHGFGLFSLNRLLRLEAVQEKSEHIRPVSARGLAVTLAVVLGLFVLHGIEIWLYAFLFNGLGAIQGLRNAVYFSTTTYGAIGYDDSMMLERWRLVSAIEGINGIVLIGWSTAFFVTRIASARRI
jgi:hypothetical protein